MSKDFQLHVEFPIPENSGLPAKRPHRSEEISTRPANTNGELVVAAAQVVYHVGKAVVKGIASFFSWLFDKLTGRSKESEKPQAIGKAILQVKTDNRTFKGYLIEKEISFMCDGDSFQIPTTEILHFTREQIVHVDGESSFKNFRLQHPNGLRFSTPFGIQTVNFQKAWDEGRTATLTALGTREVNEYAQSVINNQQFGEILAALAEKQLQQKAPVIDIDAEVIG